MICLLFALNVLTLGALIYSQWQHSKERQSLSLLIKSRDVEDFVRADQQLRTPPQEPKPLPPPPIPLNQANPDEVAAALEAKQ